MQQSFVRHFVRLFVRLNVWSFLSPQPVRTTMALGTSRPQDHMGGRFAEAVVLASAQRTKAVAPASEPGPHTSAVGQLGAGDSVADLWTSGPREAATLTERLAEYC